MKAILLGAFVALTCCLLPGQAVAESEISLREFLYSTPKTYGWQPVHGDINYDFFKDGRLHVQGKDGEATMWEGTWKLQGDQLTLKVPELKTNRTFTAAIKGRNLLLDSQPYRRYTP
jgi:hypothetical protein